jgi:formylglycine-generating enzyme required for sulfatase activity/serine/threonine protein phosphatase PrpC
MAFQSEIAGTQIDGARDYQEDAFLITHLSDAKGNPSALIIVADGMGGHAAGNVASNMAVQAFNKSITTNYPTEDISGILNESLLRANAAIAETVKETPALDGMGCTMIGVIIEGTNLSWVSVGDSHLYLLRDRKLIKLNADHSYGGFLDRMEASGTPVEAEPGLSRNMLMSAVTGSDVAEIDCPPTPITLEHDDKLIICSDGMDTLSEGKIIQYSDWADSPKECAEALMDAVEDAAMPRQDNTTAVVVKVIDDSISEPVIQEEDDDDEEDITTPGAVKADKTAEMEASPEVEDSADIVEEPDTADVVEEPDTADVVIDEAPVTEEEIVDVTPDEAATDVDVTERVDEDSDGSKKSNKGLLAGIAASVLVALVVGGYFMFGGSSSDGTSPEEIISDDVTPEETIAEDASSATPEVTERIDEEEEIEAAAETDDVVAEIQPAPEPKPEPKAEPVTAPVLQGKKEFQDDLQDGGKTPVMVVIPAGTFEMGSPSSSRFTDERPRHTVKIKSFAVSKYEVTFAEYDKFANKTDRKPPNDLYMDRETHPVIFVKWDDAYYYTKWLSEQTGKKYRLLSESEWEYAASTGAKSPFWWGFSEEAGKAHCFGCETGLDPRKPSKIGGFEANKFGLHDTAGNVAEWVKDCWHENYKGAPTDNETWEGGDCTYRAVRGGAYISPQQSIRSAKRDKLKSDSGYDHVGIRIARELD